MALRDREASTVPNNQGVGAVAGHGVSGVCATGPGGEDGVREAGSLVATAEHGLIGIGEETNAGVSGTGSSTGLSATTEARCESRWRLASRQICLHVHVCMYVYVCACMWMCMYTHICIHMQILT